MTHLRIFLTTVLLPVAAWAQMPLFPIPENSVRDLFPGQSGAFVLVDCTSGERCVFNPEMAAERLPPCSTFKIWNTLIGLENGIITSPDEAFYTWDGTTRFLPEWNKDQTLREAFQVSCVPAFQNLARKIGPERMQQWINKIGYGDQDASAGIDVFWLPSSGRKTILISPEEQARLLCKLVAGELPFSAHARSVLKEIMVVKTGAGGVLYGKTGSSGGDFGPPALGWFVGYVECQGRNYAFACVVRGEQASGKEARARVITILERSNYL